MRNVLPSGLPSSVDGVKPGTRTIDVVLLRRAVEDLRHDPSAPARQLAAARPA